MLAIVLAASLAGMPAAAVSQQTPTQAQYNEFKRCQGEFLGFYRAGVIIFGGTQFEGHVHEAGRGMTDLLIEIDNRFMQTGVQLDWQDGYSRYMSGYERWSSFPNRRDADDVYFDSSPMTDQCNAAVGRIATFLDSR
jgi:hypothetical protein